MQAYLKSSVFNSFSYTKKARHLSDSYCSVDIAQIALSITSSPSSTGFYAMRSVKYGGW